MVTLCRLRRCFQSVLVHLQLLWELLLLGEPLVVMAPSPTASSETVLALVRYGRRQRPITAPLRSANQ